MWTTLSESTYVRLQQIERLKLFQEAHGIAVADISRQAPAEALHSLRDATLRAPENYQNYLSEAVDCYESRAYRAAILMVWSATVEHIYSVIQATPNGFRRIEAANSQRFGNTNKYKKDQKEERSFISERS